jgi:ParB-like chromosome segregation protein Spo0J
MHSAQSILSKGQHGVSQVPKALPSAPEDFAALETTLLDSRAAPKLNPVEEARACASLIKELGLTQRQMAERMGCTQSAVSHKVRLLNLSEEILGFVERGELCMHKALTLLTVKDLEVRGALARTVVAEGWSAGALEAHVRRKGKKQEQHDLDAAILTVAKALGDVLSVEADADSEPYGRVTVRLNFTSVEAALASVGQLSGSPVEAKGSPSGSDGKAHVPRKITQRARTSASAGAASGSERKAHVPQKIIQRARSLAWATALGAITVEALAERDGLSTAMAQKCLDEAVSLGFMERHSVLVGYSALYRPTTAGRRLACKHADAGGYTYPKRLGRACVSIGAARHTIACVSAVAALERRYPRHRVIGERELHRDERSQGRRLGSVDIHSGETRSHFPDIVIWGPSVPGKPPPLPIAVEIELTPKERERRTAICCAWADASHIEVVHYYAETPRIEKGLLDTIRELKAEHKIVVKPLSEILRPLPGFDLSRDVEPTTDH